MFWLAIVDIVVELFALVEDPNTTFCVHIGPTVHLQNLKIKYLTYLNSLLFMTKTTESFLKKLVFFHIFEKMHLKNILTKIKHLNMHINRQTL